MSITVRLVSFIVVLFVLLCCVGLVGAESACKSACCASAAKAECAPNELTKEQIKDGWVLLFDGKTGKGWVGIGKDKFPEAGWEIKDGVLTVNPAVKDGEKPRAGDIVTAAMYANYEFQLDFKISEGANSGIKYFVREEDAKRGRGLGLEYQILDDNKHPDAKQGKENNRTVSSLYDLIAADKGKKFNGVGEWNTAKIVSKGKHIEHWLNGKKVLEYERGSKAFMELIVVSKYNDKKDFGLAEKGHILLQDHNDLVSFRNIMVKKL
ncbi:MAG: DUF1080 domain-containing protein [Planctomycetes bacterium]|nr:DUF1080 domain-containing protein [Planctomycetota bacterium]